MRYAYFLQRAGGPRPLVEDKTLPTEHLDWERQHREARRMPEQDG